MQQTGTILYTYFIDSVVITLEADPPSPPIQGPDPVDSDLI